MSMLDAMFDYNAPAGEPFAISTLRAMLTSLDQEHAQLVEDFNRTHSKLTDLEKRGELLEKRRLHLRDAIAQLSTGGDHGA